MEEKALQKRIEAAKEEQLKNLGKSPEFLEQKYITEFLKSLNLQSYNIRSDGSCLYAAIIKSCTIHIDKKVEELRNLVATYLEENSDDYCGFVEGDFSEYLKGVKDGSLWGGELELTVISKILDLEIDVVKWNGSSGCEVNKFTPENKSSSSNKAVITYHRHLMQSEHYNAAISC